MTFSPTAEMCTVTHPGRCAARRRGEDGRGGWFSDDHAPRLSGDGRREREASHARGGLPRVGAQAIRVKANELAEERPDGGCRGTRRRIEEAHGASRSCCSAGESRGWRR